MSFPWKRGPHDQLIEYNDAIVIYDNLRLETFKLLSQTQYIDILLNIFHNENEQ
jgi:hypothetical protein